MLLELIGKVGAIKHCHLLSYIIPNQWFGYYVIFLLHVCLEKKRYQNFRRCLLVQPLSELAHNQSAQMHRHRSARKHSSSSSSLLTS